MATSLGLGAIQIIIVTFLFMLSAQTGLNKGIKSI
ncbi:hypothetical protein EMIT0180MI3_20781 [Priestia megaterium]